GRAPRVPVAWTRDASRVAAASLLRVVVDLRLRVLELEGLRGLRRRLVVVALGADGLVGLREPVLREVLPRELRVLVLLHLGGLELHVQAAGTMARLAADGAGRRGGLDRGVVLLGVHGIAARLSVPGRVALQALRLGRVVLRRVEVRGLLLVEERLVVGLGRR